MGTWDYFYLESVPAAGNSLQRMRALLTGPLCGWPADRVTVIVNRLDPGGRRDQLVELFSDTGSDGIALFYYVGHCQPDDQGRLCLGLMRSRADHDRRASTNLPFDDVRGALVACAASTKIVMLDCCFAGSATQPRQSFRGTDVLDMVSGTGVHVMAVCGAHVRAFFETGMPWPQTYFTKYFVDVVESGIAGQPERLTLGRIFAETRARLGRDRKPEPTYTAHHEAGRTVFARNAARGETYPPAPKPLPPWSAGVPRPTLPVSDWRPSWEAWEALEALRYAGFPPERRWWKTYGPYAFDVLCMVIIALGAPRFDTATPARVIAYLVSTVVLTLLPALLRLLLLHRSGHVHWRDCYVDLEWMRWAALILGAAIGYLFEPVATVVRTVLAWGL